MGGMHAWRLLLFKLCFKLQIYIEPTTKNLERDMTSKHTVTQLDNDERKGSVKEEKKIIHSCTSSENDVQKSLEKLFREVKISSVGDGVDKKDEVLKISLDSSQLLKSRRKKLLVLDLNGLLVDVVRFSYSKRPFCDDFLKFCFENFDVGVWSSRNKKNLDEVVDYIMGDSKHKLLFCWDQSHCTNTGLATIENNKKPLLLKELKKIWDKNDRSLLWGKGTYNESNTLLLDDSPYKALCNPPHTAIFPFSYSWVDTTDNSLGPGGDLRVYLERLVMAENVQKYVEQHPFGQSAITNSHPSWSFYQQVICSIAQNMKRQGDLSSTDLMEKWEHFKI